MARHVKMDLADIKILPEFLAHPPREEKVLARKSEYQSEGKLRRPMAVTPDGVLVDGYASFLALKALGKKSAQFKLRESMAVVEAVHPANPEKPYYWRINHTNGVKFSKGDRIAVKTRYGVKEAIVNGVSFRPAEECIGLSVVIGLWNPDKAREAKSKNQEDT